MNAIDATPQHPARLRTSDTEREEVALILRAAMTEGRLDLTEGEARLGACYAARYRDELAPLTLDLPDGGRRALAETPRARAEVRRHLLRHAVLVSLAAAVLTGWWALGDASFFWPAIPLFFLVTGFVRHARFGHYEPRFSHRHHISRAEVHRRR